MNNDFFAISFNLQSHFTILLVIPCVENEVVIATLMTVRLFSAKSCWSREY